jgi:glycosyltransferase involved in cell wall biosynthesis
VPGLTASQGEADRSCPKRPTRVEGETRSPQVTVVIPAYRAAATIGQTLVGLLRQRGQPEFEVIVIDSSPDASTVEAARLALEQPRGSAAPEHRIEHLPERAFPGAARNRGAALARAPLLLFLDADTIPASDLLDETIRALEGNADVVGGSIALPARASVSARLRHLLLLERSLPGLPRRSTWMLPAACVAYRRAVFEKYGGYPDTRATEDWMLHWRMWQAGERLVFEPSLAIAHQTPSGWLALARYTRFLGYHYGVARTTASLPDQAFERWLIARLVRWPILAAGMPIVRTLRAVVWFTRYAPAELVFLALVSPAYLAMTLVWARGFASGLRSVERRGDRLEKRA